jgi:signal transduction histidine kinase
MRGMNDAAQDPISVLVVDDDRIVLRLMSSWLRESGWAPEPHENPHDALESYMQRQHQVVVIDWSLPGMDGIEVVRRLRSANQSGQAYLILVTAADEAGLLMRAFEEGVDDFLRKPISKMEFLSRMKAARRVCNLEEEIRRRSSESMERSLHGAAMQRMSAVAGAVAHELRTPLGALRLSVERLHMKRERIPEDMRKIVDRIEDLSRNMAETMSNVLDSFGLDEGANFWERFDFALAVTEGFEQIRHKASPGVETILDAEPCVGFGDPTGIRRLVGNLVGNALRHTKTGSVTVRLHPGECGFAILEVEDTGTGIAPELLPWLGEPMLLNSESAGIGRYVQGNGMGLGLCRKIVEKHHGQLSIRSTLGRGTQVRAELRTDREHPVPPEGTGTFFTGIG